MYLTLLLKLYIKEKSRQDIIVNENKNFLVCLLKIIIKKIAKTKSNIGILLPERIMPIKNIMNKKGIKYFDINFEVLGKNKGKIKKLKIENL